MLPQSHSRGKDVKPTYTLQDILERSLIVNRWFSWLRLSSFIVLSFGFDLFGPMSLLSVTCLIVCAIVCARLIFIQQRADATREEELRPLTEFAEKPRCSSNKIAQVNAKPQLTINHYVLHIFNLGLFALGLFKGGDLLLNVLTTLYGPNPIWLIALVCVGLCLTLAWIDTTFKFIESLKLRRVCLNELFSASPSANQAVDMNSLSKCLSGALNVSSDGPTLKKILKRFEKNPYNVKLSDQSPGHETFNPTKRFSFFGSSVKNKLFRALLLIAFLGLGYAICVIPGPWQTVVPAWTTMMNCALSIMVLAVSAGVLAWYDSAPNNPKAAGCLYGLYAFGMGMMVSFGMLNVVGVALNAASVVSAIIVSLLYALNYGYFEYQCDLLDRGQRAFCAGHRYIQEEIQLEKRAFAVETQSIDSGQMRQENQVIAPKLGGEFPLSVDDSASVAQGNPMVIKSGNGSQ